MAGSQAGLVLLSTVAANEPAVEINNHVFPMLPLPIAIAPAAPAPHTGEFLLIERRTNNSPRTVMNSYKHRITANAALLHFSKTQNNRYWEVAYTGTNEYIQGDTPTTLNETDFFQISFAIYVYRCFNPALPDWLYDVQRGGWIDRNTPADA